MVSLGVSLVLKELSLKERRLIDIAIFADEMDT